MLCPHCGFTNKPGVTRCECCLGEVAESSEASLVESAPSAEAEPSLPQPPPPETGLETEEAPPAPPLEPSKVPARAPSVPKAALLLIVGLVVVGALGGLWLMKRQTSEPQPSGRRAEISSSPAPTQPSEPSASPTPPEVAPTTADPSAPPEAATEPTPAPPESPADATPAVSPEEEAKLLYQIGLNFLRKGQRTQARQTLQEVVQKYPDSRVAPDARSMLKRFEEPPPRPGQARTGTASRSAPRPRRGAGERGTSVVTTDELLEGRRAPRTARRRKPAALPPSIQAARTGSNRRASAATRDDVRLISVTQQQGNLVVLVQYRLASQHQRPVHVGAWVLSGGAARNFSYSASPIVPGGGTTRVTLSGASSNVSRLRIAFFEEGGRRFFSKDLTVPK